MDQEEQRRNKPRSCHSLPGNSSSTVNVSKVLSRLKKVIPEVEKKKTKQQEDLFNVDKLPQLSNWSSIRPFLSSDFVVDDSDPTTPLPIAVVPGQSQENILMDDLLTVLSAFQGIYIRAQPLTAPYGPRSFIITDSFETTLRHLIEQMLPLASDHSIVIRFIEEKMQMKWGRVNQALAEAMDSLITDFLTFIAQLETQLRSNQLTLQKMWVYLQPSMQTFKVLAKVATRINQSKAVGGKTLTILYEEIQHYITDKEAQKICIFLASKAAVPFFDSMQRWLHKGVVFDPYNEFLVKDNKEFESDNSDRYWSQRYILVTENVPVFLSQVQETILSTGRYLNAVRQCHETSKSPMDFVGPPLEKLEFSLHEEQYLSVIEKAYQFASSTLLDLLMTKYDIINRIKSLKRYFLMEQGDFIVQLLDLCEEELVKPISEVVPSRLQSLFELALRTSSGKHDPYKEDITLTILTKNNTYQIFTIQRIGNETAEEVIREEELVEECSRTGLEGLAFHVVSKWPLSLLFNTKIIGCYQMLFRHLLHCKHVDRRLCRVWMSDKAVKQLPQTAASGYLGAFSLRQQMLFFVQNLEYYMMEEAIEPNWRGFMTRLSEVKNIDDLLIQHQEFVNQCMKDCMFMNHDLLLLINHILAVCIEFCDFIQSSEGIYTKPCENQSFENNIRMLNHKFTLYLTSMLNTISTLSQHETIEKLPNIIYRENFNGFYKDEMARQSAAEFPPSVSTSG